MMKYNQFSWKDFLTFIQKKRMHFFILHDVFVAFISLLLSLYIKIGDEFLDYSSEFLMKNFMVFLLVFIGISTITQSHKMAWQVAHIKDYGKIVSTAALSNFVFFPLMLLLSVDESFSKVIPVINLFILTFLLVIPRLLRKMYLDRPSKNSITRAPILLLGDSKNIDHFISEIPYIAVFPYSPIGLITTNNSVEEGQLIQNIPVIAHFKNIENIENIIQELEQTVHYIMVVDESTSQTALQQFVKKAQKEKIIILKTMHKLSLSVLSVDDKTENTSKN